MKALEAFRIKQIAAEVGFDLCGICSPHNFSAEREFFAEWLERGFHGGLHYLERNVEKRFSVSELVPQARSVIVCAVSYKNDTSLGEKMDVHRVPKVASYARTADYHTTIKGMLARMASLLGAGYGEFRFRAFTDTAPVLEKRLAVEAGLGFIGRNTLLVSPSLGSFVLLGEIVTDRPVDAYDTPYGGKGCGNCTRCVDHCPTGALTCKGLDARRCISRLTIEKVESATASTGTENPCRGWIFGCDECQSVCPYNAAAPFHSNPLFDPLFDPCDLDSEEWLGMTGEDFTIRFGSTPLARAGLERIKRLLSERR